VEHVFRVMKRQFGFDRVRYRGLKKNANRMFTCFALVNLYVVRKRLVRRRRSVPGSRSSSAFWVKSKSNST
jgi:IS5 family transposase